MSQPPQSPSPLTARLYDLEYPRSLGVYSTYQEVQAVVDTLADKHFPVQSTLIVGTDLKLMERVTGRKTWGRIIGQGIMSGLWMGLFLGILLFLITSPNSLWVVLTSVLMGIVFFTVWTAVGHLLTGGKRDFTSMTATIPMQYELLVEHKHAEQARHLLAESGAVPMTSPPPTASMPGHDAAGHRGAGSAAPQQYGRGQFGQRHDQQQYGQQQYGQQQFGQGHYGQQRYGQGQYDQGHGQQHVGRGKVGQAPGPQDGQGSPAWPGSAPGRATAPEPQSGRPSYGQPTMPSPASAGEAPLSRASRPSFGQPAGTPLREDEHPADPAEGRDVPSAPDASRPSSDSPAEDDPYRGSR